MTRTAQTQSASAARLCILTEELERYLRLLVAHEQPDRVIVFGSLATGDVHPWSDIDLVIVKPTSLPFWKRLRRVRQLLKPQVGTDILYYTPEEFAKLQQERVFVREEIAGRGKVVYERAG